VVSRGRLSLLLAGAAAVLVAGLFFRFGGLDDRLFWHDEVYTKFFAAGHSSEDWQAVAYTGEVFTADDVQRLQRHDPARSVLDTVRGLARDEPQHPPLYYVLARLHVSAFGNGVATIRALSAALSLLALPALFWLCIELFGDRRVARTAVLLLAVSPFFVLYATEAREYALWTVLILASTAALLRALRLTEEGMDEVWGAWALVSVTVALSLYTSFSSAAVIIVQVGYVGVRARLRPNRASLMAAASMAVAAVLFLPWALVLQSRFEAFSASMAWSRTIVIPRIELLATLPINASRTLVDIGPSVQGAGDVLLVGLVSLLLVWALVELGRRGDARASVLVIGLVVVPVGLLLIPDLLSGGIRSVSGRYLTPAWLGGLMAVAWLLGRAGPRRLARQAVLGVVLGAAMVSCAMTMGDETVWSQSISEEVPEAARLVAASSAPLVVANREAHYPGNLLAMALLLKPATKLQFAPLVGEYVLPEHSGDVYLFCPNDPFRHRLEVREAVRMELLLDHLHLQLWRVRR
jgi:uncharacterized membrane protein